MALKNSNCQFFKQFQINVLSLFLLIFEIMFRIQKILLVDYHEIYEPVLVESPFAEVTENGIGIRQVQLGLTPTKIIIGQDFFKQSTSSIGTDIDFNKRDPEIECFELVTVLPLEALRFDFFKKSNRIIMNVRILEFKSLYFEFGGYLSKNLFWNTWRERIATLRFMGPNLFNITRSSPFSSTDVIPDEEEISVSVYPTPRNISISHLESPKYPPREVEKYYTKFASLQTDLIERASNISLDQNTCQQMELNDYFRFDSVTNDFSCGCNKSW